MQRPLLVPLVALGGIAVALAACSGGGGGPVSPPAVVVPVASATPSHAPVPDAKVVAEIVIPKAVAPASNRRRRAYVSPDTSGLIVTVHDANGTTSYGYGVAANAPGCSVTPSGQTSCLFQIFAAPGSDTFDAYTYDQSEGTANPTTLGASFTARGNLLSEAIGDAPPPIVADQNNTVSLTLGAVIATVSETPSVLSVSGNGGTTNAAGYHVFDADANDISQYEAAPSYENSLQLSIADGGGDHSQLGGTATLSPTVTFDGASAVQPTDASSTPYYATVTGQTSLTNSGYGSASSYPTSAATVTVAPLFLYAPSGSTQAGSTATLYAIAEATPSGASYTVAKTADSSSNDCDNFSIAASGTAPVPPQVAVYTITANAGSAQSGGMAIPCVFAVSDGTGTTTDSAPFAAGSTNVIIVVPTHAPTATPSAAPPASPSASPTASPSPAPTASPSPAPTASPSPAPTASPTAAPPTPAPSPTTAGNTVITVPTPAPSVTSTH